MAWGAGNENAVARAIKHRLGATVQCHRIESSSSGGVFLIQHKTGDWIAKVFRNEERRVAIRTIHVLRQLEALKVAAPRLVCNEVISFGQGLGYVYDYIVGPCLRDAEQPVAAYRSTGRLIYSVSSALRECWNEGDRPDLFDKFDLDCQLDQGVRYLSEVSHDLAVEARERLSNGHRVAATELKLVHADLHMGNVLMTNTGLVAIDFDSMCLGPVEKAFAALIGKIYERELLATSRGALIEAVIAEGEVAGVRLDLDLLQLCALEKKLGELRYLDRTKSQAGLPWGQEARYRDDAMRGLMALLREWDRFPTRGGSRQPLMV